MYNRSLNNQKWKSWLTGHLAGAEKPVRLVVHTHSHGNHVQMGVIVFAHPDTRGTLMAPVSSSGADDA